MEQEIIELTLLFILLVAGIALFILWRRNKKLQQKMNQLKKGNQPLSLTDKALIALRLKKKEKPQHTNFKEGDVNIRVW